MAVNFLGKRVVCGQSPREALRFCDDFRRKHQCMDVPDDIILRSIIGRRKHPGA
jgi:hypothetical protein